MNNSKKFKFDTSKFTDPEIIGPGIWYDMHTYAVKAIDDTTKNAFIIYLNNLCDNFRCIKCKVHFRKFIDNHDFADYWNIYDENGNDIGFFQYTWELHNKVNIFLGKYCPTLEEAYYYYTHNNINVCINCGNKKESNNYNLSNLPDNIKIETDIDKIIKTNNIISKKHKFKIKPRK